MFPCKFYICLCVRRPSLSLCLSSSLPGDARPHHHCGGPGLQRETPQSAHAPAPHVVWDMRNQLTCSRRPGGPTTCHLRWRPRTVAVRCQSESENLRSRSTGEVSSRPRAGADRQLSSRGRARALNLLSRFAPPRSPGGRMAPTCTGDATHFPPSAQTSRPTPPQTPRKQGETPSPRLGHGAPLPIFVNREERSVLIQCLSINT